jgi:glycine betaine transporter
MVISTFSSGGRNIPGSRNDKNLIVFWGTVLGILSFVLIGSGGLKALQTASIIGALPFLFIIYGLLANLIRELVVERRSTP